MFVLSVALMGVCAALLVYAGLRGRELVITTAFPDPSARHWRGTREEGPACWPSPGETVPAGRN